MNRGGDNHLRRNLSRAAWILLAVVIAAAGIVGLSRLIKEISSPVYEAKDLQEFDRAAVLARFGGDLDSDLSVFPDPVPEGADVLEFEASFQSGLFDTDGIILLHCAYDEAQFQAEIARLSGLSKTIRSGEESYTNRILYEENTYKDPAFIANAGFGNTYEYALIREAAGEIIYLYLAYPDPEKFAYPEYLMRDLTAYEEENTYGAFSMYNHSFDQGNSYVEFDD